MMNLRFAVSLSCVLTLLSTQVHWLGRLDARGLALLDAKVDRALELPRQSQIESSKVEEGTKGQHCSRLEEKSKGSKAGRSLLEIFRSFRKDRDLRRLLHGLGAIRKRRARKKSKREQKSAMQDEFEASVARLRAEGSMSYAQAVNHVYGERLEQLFSSKAMSAELRKKFTKLKELLRGLPPKEFVFRSALLKLFLAQCSNPRDPKIAKKSWRLFYSIEKYLSRKKLIEKMLKSIEGGARDESLSFCRLMIEQGKTLNYIGKTLVPAKTQNRVCVNSDERLAKTRALHDSCSRSILDFSLKGAKRVLRSLRSKIRACYKKTADLSGKGEGKNCEQLAGRLERLKTATKKCQALIAQAKMKVNSQKVPGRKSKYWGHFMSARVQKAVLSQIEALSRLKGEVEKFETRLRANASASMEIARERRRQRDCWFGQRLH